MPHSDADRDAIPGWRNERTSLRDKAAVINGGSTGIGRATALLLAAHGARVLITGRHEDDLKSAVADIEQVGEGHWLQADSSDAEAVHRVFKEVDSRLGGIDILVNNAAIPSGSVVDTEIDDLRRIMEVNVNSYFHFAHHALLRMDGGGDIVNLGSMSIVEKEGGNDIYIATKMAIAGFSESLRKKVGKRGVRVTLVSPGLVDTDLIDESENAGEKVDAGDALAAEDVAECIVFALRQPRRSAVVDLQVRPIGQAL